jgi:hypothetical protein
MEPRRFYLDTANRSFVASPDTTVPAPTNLFFREDVEAVELYFLRPTGNLAAPYEYRDYSANTVKLAVGLTTPAALQTAWTSLSTGITAMATEVVEGGGGSNAQQIISFSGRKPVGGGFFLTIPARTINTDNINTAAGGIVQLPDNGLLDGQFIIIGEVDSDTASSTNSGWFVRNRTASSFQFSATPNGALFTDVNFVGSGITVPGITTASLPYNATAANIQQAFVDAGIAVNGLPQIIVTGSYESGFYCTFTNALADVDFPVMFVSSTLAAAPCLSANVSFNTTEVAALVTAGNTSNLRFEVEVSGSGRRQTYATSCDISADIIASASTSPVPIGTANSFSLSDGAGGVWTVTVDANGILTTAKQ